jgi:hypothetical protein
LTGPASGLLVAISTPGAIDPAVLEAVFVAVGFQPTGPNGTPVRASVEENPIRC